MAPEMGRAAFRLAFMIMVPAAALLFIERPGSVVFIVTVFCLALGIVFLGIVTAIIRFFSH